MKCKLYIFSLIVLSFFSFLSCEQKSGRKNSQKNIQNARTEKTKHITIDSKGKTIINMTKQGGVYYIPCKINGNKMEFIFDTGASIISISQTEANFLYKQGKLTDDDIKGTAKFSDANGDISEGTIINLKTVQIGDRILHNIEASVVHNLNAPLLFGQSALQKFGKVSIDYKRNEITFE